MKVVTVVVVVMVAVVVARTGARETTTHPTKRNQLHNQKTARGRQLHTHTKENKGGNGTATQKRQVRQRHARTKENKVCNDNGAPAQNKVKVRATRAREHKNKQGKVRVKVSE